MTHPTRATVLALAAGAIVAGIGAPDTPSRAAAPARAAAAAAERATDRTTARRAVLRPADVPGGWTASAPSSTRKPSACPGTRQARAAATARRTSQNFDHPPSQVSHTVYLYADVRRARSAYAKLTSAATRRCVSAETKTKLESTGATLGAMRTSRLKIARVGDQSTADRIAVDYRASGGGAATLTLDLVYVREGRGLSLLALVDETGAFDAQLRTRLTSVAGRRLRNLLAT